MAASKRMTASMEAAPLGNLNLRSRKLASGRSRIENKQEKMMGLNNSFARITR
jgi:hypothetical protein